MVPERDRDICFVLGHFGLTLGFAWRDRRSRPLVRAFFV